MCSPVVQRSKMTTTVFKHKNGNAFNRYVTQLEMRLMALREKKKSKLTAISTTASQRAAIWYPPLKKRNQLYIWKVARHWLSRMYPTVDTSPDFLHYLHLNNLVYQFCGKFDTCHVQILVHQSWVVYQLRASMQPPYPYISIWNIALHRDVPSIHIHITCYFSPCSSCELEG